LIGDFSVEIIAGQLAVVGMHDVQAPFCRQFLALFRYQGRNVGFYLQGDFDHLLGRRHLEVHFGLYGLAQDGNVPVLDVAAVFPQVNHYPVRSRELGEHCRRDRVWFLGVTGLPNCGNMVNVDRESGQFSSSNLVHAKPRLPWRCPRYPSVSSSLFASCLHDFAWEESIEKPLEFLAAMAEHGKQFFGFQLHLSGFDRSGLMVEPQQV
jgi:hypothetical protein